MSNIANSKRIARLFKNNNNVTPLMNKQSMMIQRAGTPGSLSVLFALVIAGKGSIQTQFLINSSSHTRIRSEIASDQPHHTHHNNVPVAASLVIS